ncbi:hypothetical protein F4678DRAFT_466735 [Xylaria arbuscula]|nr:hypothetical protein F4678DRAFT_466735 [Xylaria arbuscula]
MDRNWDTRKLNESDLSKAIIAIHLIAYPSPSMVDNYEPWHSTNHWCLFLEFINGKSVRLEVTPGYGDDGLRAKIRLISKDHPCTSNHVCKVTYSLDYTVCLDDLIEIVQENGTQRYQFAPGWEGCRHWNYVFIQDLESYSVLPRGAATRAWEALCYFYHTVYDAEVRPVGIGTFLA